MRISYLKAQTIAALLPAICIVLALTSCVDERYDLGNISPEVTIGGKEVVVPLGEIKPIALGKMLGDDTDGLVAEDGIYVFKYEDDGDRFTIDGFSLPTISGLLPAIDPVSFSIPELPSDFLFSKIESSFTLGYPNLNVAPTFSPVEVAASIDFGSLGVPLPEGGATVPALGSLSFGKSGTVAFDASFDMPAQIRNVGKIYFGESESSLGSPIVVDLEFNGLKSINGGGKLDLSVVFPSNYELLDEQGRSIGNVLSFSDYEVQAGASNVVINAYLRSIDLSQRGVARGIMNIEDKIDYAFEYGFESVAGYCNTSVAPQINISVAPKFRDMEIVTNEIEIDNEDHTSEVVYTLNGIPESVESIDYIAFESAPVRFKVEGMEWLKSDALKVETQLPACLVFEADANGYLNTATNKLVAPIRKLEEGVTLNLKAIDSSKCDVELKSGQLIIETSISSHISALEAGSSFMLSEVQPPTQSVNVTSIIDESHFILDFANSHVTMREQYFDFNFTDENCPKLSHTIDIPDELASIDRLEIANPNGEKVKVKLAISHPENEVFPVDKIYLSLSVNLKKMIHPVEGSPYIEKAPNGDNILRLDHVEWRPNENSSLEVVELELDAIENLPEITGEKGSRQIVIDEKFAVTGGVSIDAGTDVNLEATNAKLNFGFEIDDIVVSKFYGKIDYSLAPDNLPEIEFGNLGGEDLKIENLDVNPIIRFNIDNPICVPFDVSLALNPYDANGDYMESNSVSISDVKIASLAKTQLVISTKNRREQFANKEGITFVEVDLAPLLSGTMPSKIKVDLDVASDLSTTHVIDLTQSSYSIGYDYSIEIPLEFGHDFDIAYDSMVSGINEVFLNVATMPFVSAVGEVAIIADFTTTLPLDFILDVECLDVNGEPTDAQIKFGSEHMIHGHHPEDNEPEAHSTLELIIDLGEGGKLENLAEIDALRFKFQMRNNSHTPSALSPDQTLSAKLRLRVRDGITLDMNKPIEENE